MGQQGARLERAVRQRIAWDRERWRSLQANPIFREPRRAVARLGQRVDDLAEELGKGLRRSVAQRRRELEGIGARWNAVDLRQAVARRREEIGHWEARLRALGPEATLARGYALVLDGKGKPVRRAAAVKPGEKVAIRLADGTLEARVEGQIPPPPAAE